MPSYDPVTLPYKIWTHAILATLSWALFFPLSAILVRTVTHNARNVHWMLNTFSLLMFTTAWGLGVWIATTLNLWVTFNGHAIIGTCIFGLVLCQPILGVMHRYNYVSTKNSYKFAWIHVYLGRFLILAGVINGGLGLQLGYHQTKAYKLYQGQIAYGVCAGVIALTWISVSILACIRSKGDVNVGGESGPKVQGVEHLRNASEDTAVGNRENLEKEKTDAVHLNGSQPATDGVAAPVTAATDAAQPTTTAPTTTGAATGAAGAEHFKDGHKHEAQWVHKDAQVPVGGEDIVHGGDHYNTRLANVIDPAIKPTA